MERNETQGLAYIREVVEISSIPNAENIEVAKILDWKVVSRKGELSVGDKVVYFEIDSLLPISNPNFAFLEPRGCKEIDGQKYHRLKTVKLRGQISQGLIMKASELSLEDKKVGTDVTSELNLKKYEIENRKNNSCRTIRPDGCFPTHIGFDKTDETRIQNAGYYIDQWKGKKVIATVKMDGTSSTYFYTKNIKYKNTKTFEFINSIKKIFKKDIKEFEYGICSRNLQLKYNSNVPEFGNVYEKISKQLGIEQKLSDYYKKNGHLLCIQGEICGDGIQKNPLKLKQNEHKLFVFNIFNINEQKYLSPKEQEHVLKELNLDGVPVHYVGEFKWNSVDELLQEAEGKYESGVIREGLVFRLYDEPMKDANGKNSFKVVSNSYLLKYEND